jgi:hypothetical protein
MLEYSPTKDPLGRDLTMKIKDTLLILSVFIFSLAANASDFSVMSVGDVASMQLRADGRYDVICKNGNFELVTETEIRANLVCMSQPNPKSNILSVQMRTDGSFNVLCRNNSIEVATADQIRDFQVCNGSTPPPPPPLQKSPLESGMYTSGSCDFKVTPTAKDKSNWSIVIDTVRGTCYPQFTYTCAIGQDFCRGEISMGSDKGQARGLKLVSQTEACITFIDKSGAHCFSQSRSPVIMSNVPHYGPDAAQAK